MHKKLSWYFSPLVIGVGLIVGAGAFGKFATGLPRSEDAAAVVTPVVGPSWIKHLGLPNSRATAMGRTGGSIPAPASQREEPNLLLRIDRRRSSELLNETFVLTGADLYRLNCQSCHGSDGRGSPPEIKALLDPVRGASPTLVQQRMKAMGRPIDQKFAEELAADAEAALRQRLQNGGEKMPPFRLLHGDEIDALLEYLKKLAGVPSTERKEIQVTQSVARVGEHLVKGTCHVCHDGAGPWGGPMAMMRGTIPSLASFPEQYSIQQVIRHVKMGSSGMMCRMMWMMGGETMPAFPYITEEEIAAAYLYLVEYPPLAGVTKRFSRTLERRGEPPRPTTGEMCPMMRMRMRSGNN